MFNLKTKPTKNCGQYDRKNLAQYVALAECWVNGFEIGLSSVRANHCIVPPELQKTVRSQLPGIPLALHVGLTYHGPADRIPRAR